MMKVYNQLFYIVLAFTTLVIYYVQAVELVSSQDVDESENGISVRNGRFLVYTTTTTTTSFTQTWTQYLSVYR